MAPVGITHWPDSSASLAAVVQLAHSCSAHPGCSFPDRVSRNCFCCSSMVAVNAASVEPMLGSSPVSSPSCAYRAGSNSLLLYVFIFVYNYTIQCNDLFSVQIKTKEQLGYIIKETNIIAFGHNVP